VITVEDLDDADEDGVAARQYFSDLQAKAASVGLTLTRTSSGFILVTKTHSRHAGDLRTIAALLTPKRRAAT
jgi:hypothetical protein